MLYRIARSAIFQLDAEKAHDLAIENFSRFTGTPLDLFYRQHVPERPVEVMGLTFKNPVGLAAGLDKNGECIDAFGAMGFGFVEVGTVTPRPQPGNDKPRLFRLIPAEGIINRFGFNNLGVDNLVENVKKAKYDGIIGINIGKNKDTPIEKGAEDYLICMDKVYQYAGYIAVNISSPNTPGLRSLQYGEALDDLLSQLKEKQAELAEKHGKYVPLALKIAPDLDDHEILQVCDSLIRNKIDGVIGTNTTLDRSLVQGMEHCDEVGGLSGRPLQNKSTEVIRKMAEALKGELPIIGVGGIDSAISAREKMMAGASLVQVYSGFIYHGPRLVKDIVNGL
ncbi:quinone-dependent dihydroorotate dehydrogenase [Photobacterium leiognathi]|uniref:quinone-dependent dihydroorotate dehydrogenase n=1 Tax=Photobacterium leiognathi TaxID=553611 RepID=UPI0027392DD4|nr:quinone-dependent dihydroorotate dehydrogenase [Photobacterium leiognathi]